MHHHSNDCTLPTANALVNSLSILIEQESSTCSCVDYLNRSSKNKCHTASHEEKDSVRYQVTPDNRLQLVDWCYQIVDRCQFDRETVAMAMNLTDRFMGTPKAQDQDILHHLGKYQLVVVTSLYLSIKLNERKCLGSKDFEALSAGVYLAKEIEDMEWTMLQGLAWRLNSPTSLQIAYHILSLMLKNIGENTTRPLQEDTRNFVHDEVAFQIENSIQEYYFTACRPSTIAIAAILNAIEMVDDQGQNTLLMLELVFILQEFDDKLDSPLHVKEVMDRLQSMVNDAGSSYDADESSVSTLPPEATSSIYVAASSGI